MSIPLGLMAFLTPAVLALPLQAELPQLLEEQVHVETIEADVDRQRRLTVSVQIDGNGPYSFLVDTGSERTVVSNGIATALALEFAEKGNLMGVAGSRIVDTVYVDALRLGRTDYPGLIAPVLDRTDMGADGILGLDSLQDKRVLFDFEHNVLTVQGSEQHVPTRGYEIVVRARPRSGQLVITQAHISGVAVDVVIDTGAESTIGNLALQAALGMRGEALVPVTLTSVTGQTTVAQYHLASNLQIGKLRFDSVPVAFVDAPPFERLGLRDKPAVLLGMSSLRLFDRVMIDFARRKVYFDLSSAGGPSTVIRNRGATRIGQ